MVEFFQQIFDGSDFPARWHCGRWSTAHGWLHIGSDLAIFAAYLAIPLILLRVLRARQRERKAFPEPFRRIGWLFVAFILFCGISHLNDALLFFHPHYRFAGLIKCVTAIVSWITVAALFSALPRIAELKTIDQLEEDVQHARAEALSEKQRSEEAESLMKLTVDASPTALLAVDEEGRILLDNPEARRLFGYGEGELIMRSIDELVPLSKERDHAALRQNFMRAPSARRVAGGRILRALRKDGSQFPAEIGLNPIDSKEGFHVLCAVMDRSEAVAYQERMREANAELQRSNVDLESFASAASHDLRAPLRAIQNAATWLEEDIPPDALNEDARESLRLLKSRAARMDMLLVGLLEYARAGQAKLRVEAFEAGAAVREVVLLLGETAQERVRVDGELPRLGGPKVLFEQVLSNLVTNALKHGGEVDDLRVTISSRTGEAFHWFEVTDNGPGIAAQYHERIFDLFQTLRPRDEVEGAGMGLALVKKVVEGVGGQVLVESSLGSGATFRFSWPRSE